MMMMTMTMVVMMMMNANVSTTGGVSAVHVHILMCLLSSALFTSAAPPSSPFLRLFLLSGCGNVPAGPGVLAPAGLVRLARVHLWAWRRVLLLSIGKAVSSRHSLSDLLSSSIEELIHNPDDPMMLSTLTVTVLREIH